MHRKNILKQTQSYANVIVEQIENSFLKLHSAIMSCDKMRDAIYAFHQDVETNTDDIFSIRNGNEKSKIYQRNIHDLVCNDYKSIEPLTVGVFGESGSGKSHQLQLIRDGILNGIGDSALTTIPISFNAWRFEEEEHIIIPLLKTLIHGIEEYDKNFKNTLGENLDSIISHLTVILHSLNYGFQIHKSTKNLLRENTRNDLRVQLIPPEKLDSIYLNIPQFIEKITLLEKVNFVFLVDDLDRCLPENTLRILNSFELFLNVPACTFVLTLNDDIIERGVAHHYKDYQNRHHYLYENKNSDDYAFNLTLELPITGDEYMEKMIQLPTRLPTIDTAHAREFLKEYSQEWIKDIDANYDPYKASEQSKMKKPSDNLLDFFAHSIPTKPRKIKRVAMLFENKIKHLKSLDLEVDLILLAKITLLELFAPKLLRFIQNQNRYHSSLWRRLEEFRFAGKSEEQNSLEDFIIIEQYIKNISKTEKFTKMYRSLLRHLKEHYDARDRFELDYIFDGSYIDNPELDKNLKHIFETTREIKSNEKMRKVIYSPNFEKLLFSVDDPTSWRDAFKEDNLFANNKALLTLDQLDKIMQKAKSNGFIKNVDWLTLVAKYSKSIEIAKYISFDMGIYAVTFNEFDKYCDDIGRKKPDDNQWGRGFRPVINISWDDAVSYAKWKSKKEGETYRLPTSKEWSLACNLGKDTSWHFGDDPNMLGSYAWYRDNSSKKTNPVGSKIPNELGLYDMHGNVWEWCMDWCDDEHEKKIVRGGSWNLVASDMQTNDIDCMEHNHRYGIVGFRLLKERQ
ncbi:hypothetical protein MNB_SV-6-962 [hydrothermal vent metagenome]|uniref:Sulfatase-modifying factor enzyme domain-containing protein n=1 Tax=hydrothermal vent metagenome TaxID=652676 RepID=A0A1W1C6H1_9ZZZZ